MIEVNALTEPELTLGAPQKLFTSSYLEQMGATRPHLYDVTEDGQRFVVVQPWNSRISKETPAIVHVWQNWYEEFRNREQD